MSSAKLEHVNIAVGNAAKTAEMLVSLFDWTIRWEGPSALGGWTVHVGNDFDYLAIWSEDQDADKTMRHRKGMPLNHIGIVVDDLDAIEQRIIDYGFEPFSHGDYEPGRRFYFFDNDQIEYEIVSYS